MIGAHEPMKEAKSLVSRECPWAIARKMRMLHHWSWVMTKVIENSQVKWPNEERSNSRRLSEVVRD